MKLGEIKAEALRLRGMDVEVDAENVRDFEYDENYGILVTGMPGAINRCLADIESKRVLPLLRASVVPYEVRGERLRFEVGRVQGEPVRLIAEDGELYEGNVPFVREDADTLLVLRGNADAIYTLLYRPRLTRVSADTAESKELDLPEAIAAAIPYYIKGDLYRHDEPGEASEARNWYEAALEQYAATVHEGVQGTVQTVYGGEL